MAYILSSELKKEDNIYNNIIENCQNDNNLTQKQKENFSLIKNYLELDSDLNNEEEEDEDYLDILNNNDITGNNYKIENLIIIYEIVKEIYEKKKY